MPGCQGRTGHAIDRNHARSRSCGLMPALPLFRPGEVVGTFERLGWRVARQRGSHIVLTKAGAPATLSIPDHAQVARGTLRVLIAKAGLTVEEFLAAARWRAGSPRLAAERAGSVPRLTNPFPPPPTWHTVSDSRCEASEVPP